MKMNRTFGVFALGILGALAVSACSSAERVGVEAKEDVAVEASAITLKHIRIAGSLDRDETIAKTRYTAPPKYSGYKFAAAAEDMIDVWVRMSVASRVRPGDAVALLVDNDFQMLKYNDDASASTRDAHLTYTVPQSRDTGTHTFYVLFREYDYRNADVTVEFKRTGGGLDACNVDADCVAVPSQCCTNVGVPTAVHAGREQDFRDRLNCDPHQICTRIATRDYHGMPECNPVSHKCEYVLPKDIRCQGHTMDPHQCPADYTCILSAASAYDALGSCLPQCGGKRGLECGDDTLTCADDTRDDCDPQNGGRDCMGICKGKLCGGFANIQCPSDLTCIDDPTDDCDPKHGGADCGGTCVR